jgi:MFS transporter, DHA1 family, multidrug resistance protein
VGFTGFTLVMPFLPLYIRQLGVTDVGEITFWTGLSLGITPALTALLSPFWGRLADRFGRRLMAGRSLLACLLTMAAMAYVSHPWHVVALRGVLGLLTGYGGLMLTMAAESSPPAAMAASIGLVQTAQRLGPTVGPVIGGIVAGLFGLRRAFLVTACLYGVALILLFALYDERATHVVAARPAEAGRLRVRDVLRLRNFALLMSVLFSFHFVERSFGPILPLFIEQLGVRPTRVALSAGVLFSIAALSGAIGHHVSGRLLRAHRARTVIGAGALAAAAGSALMAASLNVWMLGLAAALFGISVGIATTATYSAAAAVIPPGAHGAGFGVLTSASLTGLAVSPVIAGALGSAGMRVVFFVNVAVMVGLGLAIRGRMIDQA